MKYDIKFVHKIDIRVDHAILCEDERVRTVCKKDITTGFMGLCIFGNSYRRGQEKVKKAIFPS